MHENCITIINLKAIQVFNAFLQREDAWVENQIDACNIYILL